METIKEFCKIMDEIMLDLRFLRGLDTKKVCKFEIILNQIIDEWKNEEYIPKFLCDLFIDFYPCVEASIFLYDENEKDKILYFADKMLNLMHICVDMKNEAR